jgi:hypothetical protein
MPSYIVMLTKEGAAGSRMKRVSGAGMSATDAAEVAFTEYTLSGGKEKGHLLYVAMAEYDMEGSHWGARVSEFRWTPATPGRMDQVR